MQPIVLELKNVNKMMKELNAIADKLRDINDLTAGALGGGSSGILGGGSGGGGGSRGRRTPPPIPQVAKNFIAQNKASRARSNALNNWASSMRFDMNGNMMPLVGRSLALLGPGLSGAAGVAVIALQGLAATIKGVVAIGEGLAAGRAGLGITDATSPILRQMNINSGGGPSDLTGTARGMQGLYDQLSTSGASAAGMYGAAFAPGLAAPADKMGAMAPFLKQFLKDKNWARKTAAMRMSPELQKFQEQFGALDDNSIDDMFDKGGKGMGQTQESMKRAARFVKAWGEFKDAFLRTLEVAFAVPMLLLDAVLKFKNSPYVTGISKKLNAIWDWLADAYAAISKWIDSLIPKWLKNIMKYFGFGSDDANKQLKNATDNLKDFGDAVGSATDQMKGYGAQINASGAFPNAWKYAYGAIGDQGINLGAFSL